MLNNRNSFQFSPLMGFIMLVITLVMIYFLVKGLFFIASWVMPILAIATLFIDYKVYLDYGKFVVDLFKNNWVMGIGVGILSVALMPFLILYLFAKALLLRKFKNGRADQMWEEKKVSDEYIEFEEVQDDDIPIIELPKLKPKIKEAPKKDNSYDEYFE